jgi:hypothetical protein
MAAAKTGVIRANIRMVNKRLIVINGSKIRRLRNPGILKVRRVINKFVNEIVVLIPAKITLTIAISWLPTPVNFVLQENGATNVHPAIVRVLFEHLVIYTFLRRILVNFFTAFQKFSG